MLPLPCSSLGFLYFYLAVEHKDARRQHPCKFYESFSSLAEEEVVPDSQGRPLGLEAA